MRGRLGDNRSRQDRITGLSEASRPQALTRKATRPCNHQPYGCNDNLDPRIAVHDPREAKGL